MFCCCCFSKLTSSSYSKALLRGLFHMISTCFLRYRVSGKAEKRKPWRFIEERKVSSLEKTAVFRERVSQMKARLFLGSRGEAVGCAGLVGLGGLWVGLRMAGESEGRFLKDGEVGFSVRTAVKFWFKCFSKVSWKVLDAPAMLIDPA